MPKYIKAVDAADKFSEISGTPLCELVDIMCAIHAADVAQVVHGRWIEDDTGIMHYCSECHKYNGSTTYMPKYCPNCGALMDLDGKDEDNV